jgi:hypothetical protein
MSLPEAQPVYVPVAAWRPGDQLACALSEEQASISLVRRGGAP